MPCLFWHLNCSHEPRQIASAALSHQAKQEQEQIDEIEIERQGAQYDGLAAKLGLPDLEIDVSDLLRVIGSQAREDKHALVVYPHRLRPPKAEAAAKKVRAMLTPV